MGVFDTVNGLPVHALVVHAVVVLLPLMSLLTFLVAVRPKWRHSAGLVVVADAVVLGLTLVARMSGLALQSRLGQITGTLPAQRHGQIGRLMPWFAVALLIAAVVVWLAHRRGGPFVPAGIVLSAVAGLVATGMVVVAGDTGARALWGVTVQNTHAP